LIKLLQGFVKSWPEVPKKAPTAAKGLTEQAHVLKRKWRVWRQITCAQGTVTAIALLLGLVLFFWPVPDDEARELLSGT